MSGAIAFHFKLDEISPSLKVLVDDKLKRRVVESLEGRIMPGISRCPQQSGSKANPDE